MNSFLTRFILAVSVFLLLGFSPICTVGQDKNKKAITRKQEISSPNSDTVNSNAKALADWNTGKSEKLVLNVRYLTPVQRAALAKQRVSEQIKVEDFLTQGTNSLGDMIIKREVVSGLEKLSDQIKEVYPEAILQWSSGYRSPLKQKTTSETGSTAGPHVRGDAVDIVFRIPGKSSEESAKLLAQQAKELGIKGIAIDKNPSTESYSCHLDFVRKDEWYAEQVWEKDKKTNRSKVIYKRVDPSTWGLPEGETAEQARERKELLQIKSLIDRRLINRDSLNPQMRKQLEHFEENQKRMADSIRANTTKAATTSGTGDPSSQVSILKSDGTLIPLDGNPPKNNLNGVQGFLGSHKDLQNKILSKNLPPESNSRAIEVTDMKAEGEGQIPYGWVSCSCPDAHAGLGIWVKGLMSGHI